MEWTSFPKVELHLHLDCSLSYEVVRALEPGVTPEEYAHSFKAPADCCSLLDYIRCAERPISLMQTAEQLRMVTLDLFNQLKADHVVYAEIRFAPLQHLQQGLTPEQVVQIVDEATKTGIQKTGVQAGLILCTLRHFTEEQSIQTVKLVEAFRGTTVVGFDIAADEVGYPVHAHISAFNYAHQHAIPCTAHAGEACGAPSVWETMKQLRPARIGHGVRSAEDPLLLEQLKVNGIHLEVCPTSNIKTGVFANIQQHSAPIIYQSGVSMSLNTDGRAIADTTLAREYALMEEVFQWNLDHFKTCNLEAIAHAFAPPEVKQQIRQLLEEAYR